MELREIDETLFKNFTEHHKYGTFLQSLEEKKLKETYGNKCYLVGLFQDNTLVGTSMILEIPTKLKRPLFYLPRGFVTDYEKEEYVKSFTEELIKFVKEKHGLEFIIDPYIIYDVRNSDGSEGEKNEKIIPFLKQLGYQHFGFNLNFEASQVRFMYRINVYPTYEEMVNTFSKSTRKHLEEVDEKCVHTRIAKKEELNTVVSLLKASAENKHFEYRSVSYYENMMDAFQDKMTIYISSIDFKEEAQKLKGLLKEAEKTLEDVHLEMSKVNVGSKLLKKEELAKNRILKLQKEQRKNLEYQKQYGDTLDIGTLVSMRSHDEYITLSSGMLPEFRSYNPKYAMYKRHMMDAVKEGFTYVNFYGISGDFNPKSELYGIYDLKRGFNGNVIELIGEFRYPVSKIDSFYHFLLKVKEKIKK